MSGISRREWAKRMLGVAAIGVPVVKALGTAVAYAAPKPLVDPVKNAMAKALAYVHDTSKADKSLKKDKQGVKAADQNCAVNCVFKQGKVEKIKDPKLGEIEVIGCSMFAQNSVAAKGWCKQWTKG